MTKDPGDILLLQYLDGKCTEDEQKRVERWLQKDSAHADKLEQLAARRADTIFIAKDRIKTKLLKSIEEDVSSKRKSPSPAVKSLSRSYHSQSVVRWAAAAVILLVFSTGLAIYLSQLHDPPVQETIYTERTIPAGKTSTLTLSDGSKVRLNSGSTLKFPEHFGSASREVFLEGEAFFEVTADKDRPFNVHAGNLKTTVLGTAFNIKAFPGEERTQVTVEHGKVSVERETADTSSSSVVLGPNQWVTYNSQNNVLKKEEGEIRQLIAWKDGILLFHNKTVAEVVAMLERWYGTDITVKNEALKNCVLHGEHKDESLENVLKAMQFTLDITYSFTEQGVTITGGGCK